MHVTLFKILALVVGKGDEQPDAQVKPEEGDEGVSVEDEKTAKPQVFLVLIRMNQLNWHKSSFFVDFVTEYCC